MGGVSDSEEASVVETMVKQYGKLMNIEPIDCQKEGGPVYSLEGLNLSHSYSQVIISIRKFLKGNTRARRFLLLLSGPPGTGKTEFVRHIAQSSDRRLIVKRASDLLGPYVGMTEKNTAKAFEEAREQEAILFIDEADSFLQDRSSAQRNWEVTQVNEFLVQMENFEGLLFMSTNFEDSLDIAAARRFDLRLNFGPILPEKVLDTLRRTLPNVEWEGQAQITSRLSKMNDLRFGDIRNVASRMDLGLCENDMGTILKELERELESRHHHAKIGFS